MVSGRHNSTNTLAVFSAMHCRWHWWFIRTVAMGCAIRMLIVIGLFLILTFVAHLAVYAATFTGMRFTDQTTRGICRLNLEDNRCAVGRTRPRFAQKHELHRPEVSRLNLWKHNRCAARKTRLRLVHRHEVAQHSRGLLHQSQSL